MKPSPLKSSNTSDTIPLTSLDTDDGGWKEDEETGMEVGGRRVVAVRRVRYIGSSVSRCYWRMRISYGRGRGRRREGKRGVMWLRRTLSLS